MTTKLKIYIGFLVIMFAVILVLDAGKPREIDWRPTYSVTDKIPLGLFILDNELEALTGSKVVKFSVTPYEYLDAVFYPDSLGPHYNLRGTMLAISQSNNIDEQSAKELCYFISHGNSVFLSMKTIPQTFLDSLKLQIKNDFSLRDSIGVRTTAAKQAYYFEEDASGAYFSKIDSAATTILGYQESDSLRANFIKVNYKSGSVFLHLQPAAFTNFHLLKGNHHEYAANVLSHLPEETIHWHTKTPYDNAISTSPLRYIFSQPALAWAWYLFVFGMIFFLLFNAKRKQRIVPVIEPLRNTTVEFAKTIGNLYYQEGDHNTIIDKKIIYFLEKIRTDYLIDTAELNDAFVRRLHQKSGRDIVLIERVVQLINLHRKSYHTGVESDLIQINNAIEKILH